MQTQLARNTKKDKLLNLTVPFSVKKEKFMELEDLKKSYNKKTLFDIENIISTSRESAVNFQVDFYNALFYLESTKRFREDPLFKKAQFKDYLENKWNESFNRYFYVRHAVLGFPKESAELGFPIVAKVIRKCNDALIVPKVLKEIRDVVDKTNPPQFFDKVNEIIDTYNPKLPEKTKPTISELESNIIKLTQENLKLQNKLKETIEQSKRQKETILNYEKELRELKKILARLKL